MDLDEEFMSTLAEELGGGQEPDDFIAALADQLRPLIEDGALVAFKTTGLGEGFATNLVVLTLPSGGLSLDQLESLNVDQLAHVPGLTGEVQSERRSLPAGESLYLLYTTAEGDTPATGANTSVHQYFVIDGDRQHVLTVSGPTTDEGLGSDARHIAESLELLGGTD